MQHNSAVYGEGSIFFSGCLSEPIIMLNQCLCLVKLNGTIIVIIILQLQGRMFLSFLKRIFQKIGNFFLSLNDVDKMT